MEAQIVVITSRSLYPHLRAALDRLVPPCRVTLATYEDLAQLHTVYNRYAGEADGFLVCGRGALAAIRLAPHRISKPILSFQPDSTALYRTLLRIFLENRAQDTHRVVLDALLPLGGGFTAADFLHRTETHCMDDLLNSWLNAATFHDLATLEHSLSQKLIELWKEKQMDLVVCQYSSIIPVLEAHGIPYRYPFISDYQLSEHIQRLLQEIELAQHRANLPAMVHILPRDRAQEDPQSIALLQKWITRFFSNYCLDTIVQRYQRGFAVNISVQAVQDFTAGATLCALSAYLNCHLGFEVAVGYGVGSTVAQSFNNAHTAALESLFVGGGFIKDENNRLIGPLDARSCTVLDDRESHEVARIAQDCGLSPITVRKVLFALRSGERPTFTAQDLGRRLGVTTRNAARILTQLEKGGCARTICVCSSTGKGRPAKVYELCFPL